MPPAEPVPRSDGGPRRSDEPDASRSSAASPSSASDASRSSAASPSSAAPDPARAASAASVPDAGGTLADLADLADLLADESIAPIRRYALRVVLGTTLADKRTPPPEGLSLADPGEPLVVQAPGRPAELPIVAGRAGRVPPLVGMKDRVQRARILHALANHELQAIELFAWALLAFPQAPEPFRRGLLAIVADEQRHLGLYLDRLAAHRGRFGDHPVTGHFWHKLDHFRTPLRFCCAMGLTFENANLDFAMEYATAARAAGDEETARVLEAVHEDEISHVRFGWVWMHKLAEPGPGGARSSGERSDGSEAAAEGESESWRLYAANLEWPLSPARARGKTFSAEARRRAGLDEEFIRALEHVEALQPSGARR
jgi:uncharacterized ferritin-like protein (DUF455 family)